jgi:predicted RNase H-like HicB family nuclease
MTVAEWPSLPGCNSQGETEAAAIENVREAIQGCLAARKANNLRMALEVREVEVEVA